jgi:hypothetical protein
MGQHPAVLAAWVLADQGWKPEHVLHMKESGAMSP